MGIGIATREQIREACWGWFCAGRCSCGNGSGLRRDWLAVLLNALLASQLFEIKPGDPITLYRRPLSHAWIVIVARRIMDYKRAGDERSNPMIALRQ